MRPDIQAFNHHVQDGLFNLGVRQGKWRIFNDSDERPSWPFILIWIAAAKKENSPDGYYFRFQLDNYPSQAPNICIWDNELNTSLAQNLRPKGVNDVKMLFRMDWEHGQHLYAPYERHALASHSNWPKEYPNLHWKPTDTITKILESIHRTLHSSEYYGR